MNIKKRYSYLSLMGVTLLTSFIHQQVAADEVLEAGNHPVVTSTESSRETEIGLKEEVPAETSALESTGEPIQPVTEAGETDTETQEANILKGKTPITNSPHLIEAGLSTIPSVTIAQPDAATDGLQAASNDDRNNTKIIAGAETGDTDNGYASWNPVYLQYDFGSIKPVTRVAIWRNTYDNAISTFKDVKVELSTSNDFTPETTHTLFETQDVVETVATKGQAQMISPDSPIEARYIRIWGRGHYIQNTNSSWAGYSNGTLFNEIQVFANVPIDELPTEKEIELVNLAALKKPYFYGETPTNIEAINDGLFDQHYTIQNSRGTNAFLQYEFKRPYHLKEVHFQLAPGEYSNISVGLVDRPQPNGHYTALYNQRNISVSENERLSFNIPTGTQGQYIRFYAIRKDGEKVGYSEIQILGHGNSYDESMPDYQPPQSKYDQLVWSDEFDGDRIDESKWQIIDGMWNHAAIYNKGAVSIKKDGDKSYLSIRSKNYNSSQELIKAVGWDRYDNKNMPEKVTWSSGRIESKDKYSFQYGRVAVRAKVNDSKGIWPAIWMLAQDETGHDEIDILEYLGQDAWDAWTTNHFGILAKNKESHGVAHKNFEAWSQEFHVYEVEWSPEKLTWFIDGQKVFETTRGKDDRDGMHSRPMFPILETQIGDGWVGDVDYSRNMTKQDSEYLIDWIRIYQEKDQKKTYFDNLNPEKEEGDYFVTPVEKIGALTFVSDGSAAHENKNNFFYGGQPRYETSRLYAATPELETALIYKINQPSAVHLTSYYKTLEDAKSYNSSAWADEGKSIRKYLKGTNDIDFTIYTSTDGNTWTPATTSVVDNFVEATPAYARTTFDANNLPAGTQYIKIVFPKLTNHSYRLLSGEIRKIQASDIQLAKVTFLAPDQGTIHTETKIEVIPFKTIRRSNPNLPRSQERNIQSGQEGERTIVTEVTTLAGQTSHKILSDMVTKQAIHHIIEIGIKPIEKGEKGPVPPAMGKEQNKKDRILPTKKEKATVLPNKGVKKNETTSTPSNKEGKQKIDEVKTKKELPLTNSRNEKANLSLSLLSFLTSCILLKRKNRF